MEREHDKRVVDFWQITEYYHIAKLRGDEGIDMMVWWKILKNYIATGSFHYKQ